MDSGASQQDEHAVVFSVLDVHHHSYLEFPPGVEFLEALHSLLSVHHGCYSGALLWKHTGSVTKLKRHYTTCPG